MRYVWPMLATLALGLTGTASADPMYVQSERTALREEPFVGAEALEMLEQGTQVERLKQASGWYHVRHEGREGWLSRLTVSNRPPMDPQTIADGEQAREMNEARRRPSQVASAAAARGLTPEERERLSAREAADYAALERLEELRLTKEEIEAFEQEVGNE